MLGDGCGSADTTGEEEAKMIELRWPGSVWKIRRVKSEEAYYLLSDGTDKPPSPRMGELEEGPIVEMKRIAVLLDICLPDSEKSEPPSRPLNRETREGSVP